MDKKADEYRGMGTEWEAVHGGGGGISLRSLKTFSSFKNHVYRLYYGAMLGQMAPMNMQMIARSLLIYRLTGSAAILGVMSLANAIPMLLLSLLGGAIADRVQKKYVLLMGQASSAVVSLGIALTLTLGYLSVERSGSWWILVVASVLQGAIMGLMMPSRQAIIREIVSEGQLMNAIALNSLGMNVFRLAAPALAGFLVDAFGFAAVYYTMTGMYLVSVIFVAFMPLTSKMTAVRSGALARIKEGLQYIRHENAILLILLFTLITVVLSMPYMFMLPIFADDILKVGATGMGFLISVSGIGALLGSLALASLPDRKRGRLLLLSSLILGLALLGFSFSTSWHLSLVLIAFVGLGQAGRMTLGNTLLQYYSEDAYRGRVISIYMMNFGLMSFGTFTVGLLAEAVGVQWSLGGMAMILALISVIALIFVPLLQKLD